MAVPKIPLGEVALLNPSLDCRPPDISAALDFFPMAAVDASSPTASASERRPYADVRKGYTSFVNGDLLLAKITPCFENGKIAQASVSTICAFGSTEFHVIRPAPSQLDPRYLVHFLRREQIRRDGERVMTGSGGQRRVPRHFLESLPVPILPLAQQRRVAAILDLADTIRAKRREALAHLDRLGQAIFVEMFGDLMATSCQWPHQPVASFVAGFESGKSVAADDGDDTSSQYRVLKVSAVTSLEFKPHESKAAPPAHRPLPSHVVRPGDLLFSRANTAELIGATALVATTPPNLLLPDKLWRFVWHEPARADAVFVNHLFRQPKFRGEVSRRASGSSGSMKNISQEKVLSIRVALPPPDLQRKFASLIAQIEKMKEVRRMASALDEKLFGSLQHRAFRGEL